MVALGGVCGCSRGSVCGCSGGVCMVALGGVHGCSPGGHAWLLPGACVVFAGGACMVFSRGVGGMHRIRRDTVNERVVCILLECILVDGLNFVMHEQGLCT